MAAPSLIGGAGAAGGIGMLQRSSTKLQTCLANAALARERAITAADTRRKQFFAEMEWSWMRLAASIASAERVFLKTIPSKGWEPVRCARCSGPTSLALTELDRGSGMHTLACLKCGLEQVHRLPAVPSRNDVANDDW